MRDEGCDDMGMAVYAACEAVLAAEHPAVWWPASPTLHLITGGYHVLAPPVLHFYVVLVGTFTGRYQFQLDGILVCHLARVVAVKDVVRLDVVRQGAHAQSYRWQAVAA